MRGSCVSGGSATPGASVASVMNVRPFKRQLHDLVVFDHGAEAGRLRAEQRRLALHGDLLANVADGELEIEPDRLAGGDPDALAPQRS